MQHAALKQLAHWALKPRNRYHPRWWVKVFINPFKHNRGRYSAISGRTRMDVMPYNKFDLGADSVIESFATVNNAVGDVIIGDRTLIGISDVVIGPVTIGNDVLLAQHVVLSGLNHSYEDIHTPISKQSYSTAQIIVEDGVWIGANTVVTAGVTIGRNSVVAAGSVVTRDVPPFSVAAGNPAKILKQYNPDTETWERTSALKLV